MNGHAAEGAREPASQAGHHPPAAGRPHGWSGYMQAPKWKLDLCENVSLPFQVRNELWYSFIRLVGFVSPVELKSATNLVVPYAIGSFT